MTDKILTTEKDKSGADIVIKSADVLAYSPVLPFFMKAQADLMAAGHSTTMFIAPNKSRAVFAEHNNQVVGCIVYDFKDDYLKLAYIVAGAVDPKYRGKGIYSILHRHLEAVAKSLGCTKIRSDVHPDNTTMINTMKALGKEITYYRVEKNI